MAQTTAIEWTDLSWNPTHGCSKVSPGCAHCYAETMSLRRKHTTKPWTPEHAAENVSLKPHKLREPLSGAKVWQGLGAAAKRAGKTDGKLVFVNSMSDLFHEQIPLDYIHQVFQVMERAERHTFQVLTKRPERMREVMTWLYTCHWCDGDGCEMCEDGMKPPLDNVWLGVSIENRRFVDRADLLRETPAAVRFISAEPLLGPLFERVDCPLCEGSGCCDCDGGKCRKDGLDLTAIDWLIVGGESGPRHRAMKVEWARDLCWAADDSGTAFLFKQWGGSTSKSGGRELDGRTWDEFPQVQHG